MHLLHIFFILFLKGTVETDFQVFCSVLDPHSFNPDPDPDPGFFFNPDPDPDPDPDPGKKI